MSHRKRVTNNLTALGSAAVVAVYGAGYMRTAEAAQRYAAQSDERRVPPPDGGTYEPASAHEDAAHTAAPQMAAAAGTARNASPQPATAAPPRVGPSDAAAAAGTGKTVATTPVGSAAVAKRVADSVMASPPPAPVPVIASAPTPVPVQGAQSVAPAVQSSPVVSAPVATVATTVAPPTASPAPAPPAPKPVVTPPAPVAVEAAPAKTATAAGERGKWKDGAYTGWGTSRHGDIQAYLEIDGGKITYVKVEQCLTQYSCSWIDALPMQVLTRQSPDVDAVSGATQSANAFYYAIVQALSKAK